MQEEIVNVKMQDVKIAGHENAGHAISSL